MTNNDVYDRAKLSQREVQEKRNAMSQVGSLIQPYTEGFDQINMDLCFSYLSVWDLERLENLNMAINITKMWDLPISKYLLLGEFSIIVNSRKSKDAKTMGLFTEIVTKSQAEYTEKTDAKGFSLFPKKNKVEGV
jgi:hypothetical protein